MADEEAKTEEAKTEEAKPEEVKKEPERAPRSRADDTTVYVGRKGVMSYVLAVVTQFNDGAQSVNIKARGKLISRAVDVEEIVRNRFIPDVKLANIELKTEELLSEDGTKSKVSAIEITLSK